MTLHLRGIRAGADPQSAYRVYLQDSARKAGEPPGQIMVGEFNFYGIGPGMQRDVSFELTPGHPAPAISPDGECVANITLVPAHAIAPNSAPSIDSIELWGD
ncbi:hypothetical protein BI347_16115 [Chromobacterium sphagni]|uniref:Uncharacterized protein n=1 Tax=Chromobacterium sphagni TaxID=1903179 RepID=A0A1S1WW11_9NEIS|nr:hypothetical protein [Chromobacterium sphagni]OHX11225.1 hypothetical protein BI347_16115 [Chromobacterium sphagni]